MNADGLKEHIKEKYGRIAEQSGSCGCSHPSCCGSTPTAEAAGLRLGYNRDDLTAVPAGSNLGLGCGNPLALASLKPGERVLDLGSGAGFDAFLAAKRVGPAGHILGVDMTDEMLERARKHAAAYGFTNVEFRKGDIEDLPVSTGSIDVIISNCVINLSTRKDRVFREAFRVLKPGGRLMISDLVVLEELPDGVRSSIEAYVGCVAGASLKDEYLRLIRDAGFRNIKVKDEKRFMTEIAPQDPLVREILADQDMTPPELDRLAGAVVSVTVSATKPRI